MCYGLITHFVISDGHCFELVRLMVIHSVTVFNFRTRSRLKILLVKFDMVAFIQLLLYKHPSFVLDGAYDSYIN